MRKRLIERITKSKKGSLGYTLTELLVVIGIIAVVCAIAIPSIFAIRNALRFAQANNYAKSIFLAAQQNLTEMRSDGGLGPVQSINNSTTAIAQGHCGFPDSEWSDEYVFTASNSTTHAMGYAMVLPVNSVEATVRNEQVIIEYNPITGNVYAVFFCDDDDVDLLGTYMNNQLPRDKAERKALMVGYYDGSGLSSANLEVEQTQAQVLFTNGEEAMVTVRVPMPSQYYNKQNVFEECLQVKLIIRGESSWGGSMEVLIKNLGLTDNCSLDTNGNTMLVTFPLDSLKDYCSFANLSTVYAENGAAADVSVSALTDQSFVRGDNILPGDNVTIQAVVTFENEDGEPAVEIEPGILAGINPMFDYLLPSPTEEGKYVLAVSNGRNLQNLNAIHPVIADSVESVVFTEDINWNSTVSYYNDKYGVSGAGYENAAAEAPARALPYFVPIQNENLFGTAEFVYLNETDRPGQNIITTIIQIITGQYNSTLKYADRVPTLTDEMDTQVVNGSQIGDTHATIDGQGYKVCFLNIDATRYTPCADSFYALGDNQTVDYYFAGLFGYANTTINDLHVVNPIIKGHNFVDQDSSGNKIYMDPATGALLGAGGYNTLVTNCSTYLDTSAPGFNWAYAGSAAQSVYDASSAMDWYGVSGEGAVGGLVGYAKSHRTVVGELGSDTRYLAFSNSFAAVPVSGNMRGDDWLDSQGNPQKDYGYSNGVGGFIGNSQLTNFYNCYASGNVMATNTYHASAGWQDNAATYLGLGGNGRLAMGAGGFVGTSHGTRYTNCFSAGNVLNQNRNDTTGGFVGMMCYDATKSYGHHSDSVTSAQIAQHTVFDSCYAIGMCTNREGLYLENFSGANGKIVASYGNLKTYYTGDYYKLLAPYAMTHDYDLPPYDDLYIFKDSYYLSQYKGTTGVSQDSSNKCAEPITYDELVKLQEKYDDEAEDGWISDQVEAIKTEPLDYDDILPVVQAVISEIFSLSLDDIISGSFGEYMQKIENILTTLQKDRNYMVYFLIDDYRKDMLESIYASRYSEGFPSPPWENAAEATTHYYGQASAGKVYPFPKLENMDYYGLWPEKTLDAGLAYFEVYDTEDGLVTGYYFDREDTSQLKNYADAKVVSDGYVIFTANSNDVIDVSINGKTVATGLMPDSANTVTMRSVITPDSNSYYVVTLPKLALDAAAGADGSYYYKMELNITNGDNAQNIVAYFNPNVGLSQVNSSTRPTMLPTGISVRSARQLTALASEPLLWSEGYNYVQHMNIDAKAYTAQGYSAADKTAILNEIAAGGSIGSETVPFQGSYTGRGYAEQAQIVDFVPGVTAAEGETAGTAGIFGVIGESGLVDCLEIRYTDSASFGSESAGSAGILAGISSGTIQQIDMILEKGAQLTADSAAGLLAGTLNGTMKDVTITTGEVPETTDEPLEITAADALTISAEYAGLAVGTAANAVIDNVTVIQKDLVNETDGTTAVCTVSGDFAGGFAGALTNTTAKNVTVDLDTMSADANAAAGFAGQLSGGSVTTVTVNLNTALTNTRTPAEGETVYAAGLVGISDNVEYAESSVIMNGSITGSSAAGMFGSVTHGKVQNANAVLNGTVNGTVDAAGFAVQAGEGDGTFTNCHVYLQTSDSKIVAAARAAGFAVEQGSTTLGTTVRLGTYGASNQMEASGTIQGGTQAAGYACTVTGSVNNSTVMGAAEITAASGTAAGFAADVSGSGRIAASGVTPAMGDKTSHYRFNSNSNLQISGASAAGFAANVSKTASVENSYVLGTISGTSETAPTHAGFVLTNEGAVSGSTANVTLAGGHAFAATNNGTVENCYGWYGDGLADGNTTVVVEEGDTGTYTGSYFVDIDILEGEDSAGVESVVLFDYEGSRSDMSPSELASALSLLNKEGEYNWFGPATYAAKPYSSITPATYSYPMLRVHYGDWVTKPLYAYGVMYYEVSENGNWTYNIVDLTDPELTIEEKDLSLKNLDFEDTASTIAEAGYAVFCKTTDDPNSLFAGNMNWISKTPIALTDDSGNDTAFKTQVFDSFLANVKDNNANRYSFYKIETAGELTLDGSKDDVSVVTWFANAIDVAGTAEDPYIIRTPAHFANISSKPACSFKQMHTLAAESFTTITDFSGSYDGSNLALTVAQGNTWMTTLSGSVSNVNLTVSGNVTAPVIGTVAGTVTLTDPVAITGSIDANASLFGTVTGNVTTANISVTGDVNGNVMNTVSGTVTTGNISIGNVSGTLFGAVNASKSLQIGTVSVKDVSSSACWMIGTVTDSAVSLGNITVDTSFTDANSVTTYKDVPTMIGTVTGTSVVSGGAVNLGSAALAQNLVTAVTDGASVQNFAVEAGSLKTSLIGTVTGTAAAESASARVSGISGISITAGDSTVFSGSGLLVNTLGTDTVVTGCSVQTGAITVAASDMTAHTEGQTPTKPFGGITGVVPAGVTLSGNSVAATLNVTGQNNMLTIIGGITAINNGAISGGSANATVNYTQTAGDTVNNVADDMVGIGGLVGWMRPGSSISGTKNAYVSATGAINLVGENSTGAGRDFYFVGGAVAYDENAAYSYVTTAVAVSDNWAGTALVAGDDANKAKVNPSGKGTVGKFVGYVSGGTFTECDATNTAGYYQFVGEIQANATTLQNENLYISSSSQDNPTFEWTEEITDAQREAELLAAGFQKVADSTYTYYTYPATLTGCTFAWPDGKTYNQIFGSTYIYGSTQTERDLYKAVNVGLPTFEKPWYSIYYRNLAEGSSKNDIDTGYYAFNEETGKYHKVILDYTREKRSNIFGGDYNVYHYRFKYQLSEDVYAENYFFEATDLLNNYTSYSGPDLFVAKSLDSFPNTSDETMYMIVANDSDRGLVALDVNGNAVAFTETFDLVANQDLNRAIWLSKGSRNAWKNMSNTSKHLYLYREYLVANNTNQTIYVNPQGTDDNDNTLFRLYGYYYYLGYQNGRFVTEYHDERDDADSFYIYKVIAGGKTWGTEFDLMEEIDYTCIVTDSNGSPVELSEPVAEETQTNDLLSTVTGFAGELVEGLVALLPDPVRKAAG